MEVSHGSTDRRTVLAALEDCALFDDACRDIERSFDVVRCTTAEQALEIMNDRFHDLSATVISSGWAGQDDCAFLRAVVRERCFDTIPVVVMSEGKAGEEHVRCLEEGAVDVVEVPCHPDILIRRIENAIQLRRSATFYEIESMLHVLPSMIFLKDADGRYVFSTQYWHHLDMGDDPKWTIRGKTDIDIRKDKENAIAAMEADKEIIRTGKGTSYVIEINADGIQDFIQLIKEPVFDDKGNVTGIIALGNNVTESEQMRRMLERYARIDDLTGLGNRRAFNEFVQGIPEREDFPIAVISADCDNLKIVNDTFGHALGDEYLQLTALCLRSVIPDRQLAFRVGGDEFVAFAPNATAEQAAEFVEATSLKTLLFREAYPEAVVSYGVAVIESPDDDIQAILDLADKRMYAEKARHKRNEG